MIDCTYSCYAITAAGTKITGSMLTLQFSTLLLNYDGDQRVTVVNYKQIAMFY